MKFTKAFVLISALFFVTTECAAQNQGPPSTPQVWSDLTGISVLESPVRAANLPGAVRYENPVIGTPPANTWVESDLAEWGVKEGAGAVYLQCNFVSTPRGIPLPYVQPNGQVGEPPTYGVEIYFAAADDSSAVCPTDGSKYSVKLWMGLGGVTRVPFSIVTPISPTRRIKHCVNVAFPASIPQPKSGGPTLSYTCQPILAFGGGS